MTSTTRIRTEQPTQPFNTEPTAIEHHTVSANGIRFHVAISGPKEGIPVLCLHGFPESWISWQPIMQRMPKARIYAPTLRGYPGSKTGTEAPSKMRYDVFTLTDDIKALIETLKLEQPILVAHDWGGAIAWLFAHRYGDLIRHLMVVNCPHLKTLTRALITFDDFQPLRVPWLGAFQLPKLPELTLASPIGRHLLKWSFLLREGQSGTMNEDLVDSLVNQFQTPDDMAGPIAYYRHIALTHLIPSQLQRLKRLYANPIPVPITLVWGMRDRALTAKIAQKSSSDAQQTIDWRPLPKAGHFVSLEAPEQLTQEIQRVLSYFN